MSERLEEMLRVAQAATKGFGGREWAASVATNQFRVAFKPRTAEALVKVALAAEDEMQFFPVTKELRDAFSALTAAMASEDGQSPAEGLSEAKPSEEEAPDATR